MDQEQKKTLKWEITTEKHDRNESNRWVKQCITYGKEVMTTLYYCRNKKIFNSFAKLRVTLLFDDVSQKNTFINGIHSETCERDFKKTNVESYIKDIIKSKVIDI
ncbi:hypothetical protein DMUE_4986 [Dictyocoela muelleri]|nr:hypothetical protein DMUE_4986 [Dictyocoela muelleri]